MIDKKRLDYLKAKYELLKIYSRHKTEELNDILEEKDNIRVIYKELTGEEIL